MREQGEAADGFDVERSPRYRLATLSRHWGNAVERLYEERFGLSLSQWRILAIVGAEGRIYANAIAERGMLEKPHISRLVANLLGRGLIRSTPDPLDARRNWLSLTPEGHAVFDAIAVLSLEQDRRFLAPLEPGERAELARLLDILLRHVPR